MAARTLMIQGTASHVGKSILTTALCRVFQQRGIRVAPFKAQNMSNNSFVTPDGKEIGRAQAVQAAACRLASQADFNPILIKPESDGTAQLVVGGEVAGSLSARDFGLVRRKYWAAVQEAFSRLAREFELIVLEGAGSPAEVNLRDCDVVNMQMAHYARAPVVLVGDIDRGGVFASLVGTWTLLDQADRRHLKAFVINKFRGERQLLDGGLDRVMGETGMPCAGVLPHWGELDVPEEDSLGWDSWQRRHSVRLDRIVIGIVDVPAISNFTDFEPLTWEPDVELVKVKAHTARDPDVLIFPGSKCTVGALQFVRAQALDELARRVLAKGGTVGGICSGYQLLGRTIRDPHHCESHYTEVPGLGLLPVQTTLASPKVVQALSGTHIESGESVIGYHVRMGRTASESDAKRFIYETGSNALINKGEGISLDGGRLFGTYLHGLFDQAAFRRWWLNRLRAGKGWEPLSLTAVASLDERIDRLADFVRQHLSMSMLDRLIEEGVSS